MPTGSFDPIFGSGLSLGSVRRSVVQDLSSIQHVNGVERAIARMGRDHPRVISIQFGLHSPTNIYTYRTSHTSPLNLPLMHLFLPSMSHPLRMHKLRQHY